MPSCFPIVGDDSNFAQLCDEREMLLVIGPSNHRSSEYQVRQKTGSELGDSEQNNLQQSFQRSVIQLKEAQFEDQEDEKGIDAGLVKAQARENAKGADEPCFNADFLCTHDWHEGQQH